MKLPAKGKREPEITAALKTFEADDAPLERVWASTHRLDEVVIKASVQFMERTISSTLHSQAVRNWKRKSSPWSETSSVIRTRPGMLPPVGP